jgi:hypothetical protein
MKNKDIDKKTLDLIGKNLIKSTSVPNGEIDRIIANPHLFSRVRATMAANERAAEAKVSPARVAVLFSSRNSAIFAAVALFLTTVIGTAAYIRSERDRFAAQLVVPVPAVTTSDNAARPDPPLPIQEGGGSKLSREGRASQSAERMEKVEAKQVFKSSPQRIRSADNEADGEFYAISSAGDAAETTGGGRILRVDMSRSALFALGVNVPLENDSEFVKADLMVGPDGVTRAIRVVK